MPDEPIEPREHYVYALFREDGVTPFYIGMGKGKRWIQHERWHNSDQVKGPKWFIIDRMLKRGLSIPRAKLKENLTVSEALAFEIETIAKIGRYPKGPLANMTDGGDSVRGMTPEKYKARAAKIHAKVNTPERIAKFTEWARKKRGPRSDAIKAKMSACRKGNNHRDKMSPETKARWMENFMKRLPELQAANKRAAERRAHQKTLPHQENDESNG